jgi:hypothetical protein
VAVLILFLFFLVPADLSAALFGGRRGNKFGALVSWWLILFFLCPPKAGN